MKMRSSTRGGQKQCMCFFRRYYEQSSAVSTNRIQARSGNVHTESYVDKTMHDSETKNEYRTITTTGDTWWG